MATWLRDAFRLKENYRFEIKRTVREQCDIGVMFLVAIKCQDPVLFDTQLVKTGILLESRNIFKQLKEQKRIVDSQQEKRSIQDEESHRAQVVSAG